MLTKPTVIIAIKPTINGLYPMDFKSLRLVDNPIAAIAIVKNTFEDDLIISIVFSQLLLEIFEKKWSPKFLKIIIPTNPKTKYGNILIIE